MPKPIYTNKCSFYREISKFSDGINGFSSTLTDYNLHAKIYEVYQNATFISFSDHNSKSKQCSLTMFVAIYREFFDDSNVPSIVN